MKSGFAFEMMSSSTKTTITGGLSGHEERLSLAAQFDDMCRSGNHLILDSEEQNIMNQMVQTCQEMSRELVTAKQQLSKLMAENEGLQSSIKVLSADYRRERSHRKRYERQVSEWRNKWFSMKLIALNTIDGNRELEELFGQLDLSSSGHESDYESAIEEDNSNNNDDNRTYTVEDCRVDSLEDSHQEEMSDMSLPEYIKYRSSRSLASESLQK